MAMPGELLATSQLANALAFISRSTSANMFVVASNTRPSHARAFRAHEEKLCGVQTPVSARKTRRNRLVLHNQIGLAIRTEAGYGLNDEISRAERGATV